MRRWNNLLLTALATSIVTLSMATVAGCGGMKLSSHTKTSMIVVDGELQDWADQLQYIDKANVSVGLINDTEHLYIALYILDRGVQRQIMMSGMTLWLDEKDKRSGLGIEFPGPREMNLEQLREMRNAHSGQPRERDVEEMARQFVDRHEHVRIVSPRLPQDDVLSVETSKEIQVRAGVVKGGFFYEYRVPLQSGKYEYALDPDGDGKIKIGLDSPEMDMSALREEMRKQMGGRGRSGGASSGGMGRPGAGRGAGPPGMGGGRGVQGMPDPIEVWATVTLAKNE